MFFPKAYLVFESRLRAHSEQICAAKCHRFLSHCDSMVHVYHMLGTPADQLKDEASMLLCY